MMKIMKAKAGLCIIICLAIISLTGCGKKNESSTLLKDLVSNTDVNIEKVDCEKYVAKLADIKLPEGEEPSYISLSIDGKYLCESSYSQHVYVYDTSDWSRKTISACEKGEYISGLTASHGGLYCLVKVRVFGGSYVYTNPGQQHFSYFSSFTYEYGAAHCGNGQLFVTTVDGADYLVESSLWSGQGESTYQYRVFFGSHDAEYVVDSNYISFEYGNPPDNINEFWEGLYKWINDSSILLIAADIDSHPMVLYSTCDNILSPETFYNKKR